MDRKEATNRFNALSIEHRTTIIGNQLCDQIQWLTKEKNKAIDLHNRNLKLYNIRIKTLERCLKELKD